MSVFVSNRDGGKTDEQGHYRFQTNVWSGHVIEDGLQVTENSPLGMSVLVNDGDARIPYSDYAYTGWVDGAEEVTIATADPTNPRIDRIVMYVDRGEAPQTVNPNNPNIGKFAAVAGTPAAVPVRPNDAAVESAIGAGNPYIDLADVTVGASVTQVTNANIEDTSTPVSVSKAVQFDNGYVASSQTTTSTTWTDLGTVGPEATVYVPASGAVLLTFHALQNTSNSGYSSDMSFVMSGANVSASPDSEFVARSTSVSGRQSDVVGTFLVTGLNEGVTTFTAKYQTNSGSGGSTYAQRKLYVVAL